MKKNYIFLLPIIAFFQAKAQTNCFDAHEDLIYAYSHIKSAYNANNESHLKHFSERSLEAFENVKTILEDCNCEKAYNSVYDASELLYKVPATKTYEDGRFYVKKVRDLAKEAINDLEICTEEPDSDSEVTDLEEERLKLEQQQNELKLREEKIESRLAEQQQKELLLKKEDLISINDIALSTNINTYNETLSACGCNTSISSSYSAQTDLVSKSLNDIKAYYINTAKDLANNYLSKLNQCR